MTPARRQVLLGALVLVGHDAEAPRRGDKERFIPVRAEDDRLAHVGPLRDFAGAWNKFLSQPAEPHRVEKLQVRERTGWPLGSERFLAKLERRLDRVL